MRNIVKRIFTRRQHCAGSVGPRGIPECDFFGNGLVFWVELWVRGSGWTQTPETNPKPYTPYLDNIRNSRISTRQSEIDKTPISDVPVRASVACFLGCCGPPSTLLHVSEWTARNIRPSRHLESSGS